MPAWVGQRGIKHTIGILFLGTICCSFVFHESLAFSSLEIDFSGSRDIFLEGKTQKRQPEWTWDRILGRHFLYMSDESPISLPPPRKRLLIIWLPWRNLEFAVALVLYLACIIFFLAHSDADRSLGWSLLLPQAHHWYQWCHFISELRHCGGMGSQINSAR